MENRIPAEISINKMIPELNSDPGENDRNPTRNRMI
jgi:hypothetical protein